MVISTKIQWSWQNDSWLITDTKSMIQSYSNLCINVSCVQSDVSIRLYSVMQCINADCESFTSILEGFIAENFHMRVIDDRYSMAIISQHKFELLTTFVPKISHTILCTIPALQYTKTWTIYSLFLTHNDFQCSKDCLLSFILPLCT